MQGSCMLRHDRDLHREIFGIVRHPRGRGIVKTTPLVAPQRPAVHACLEVCLETLTRNGGGAGSAIQLLWVLRQVMRW
jgi:hypothetical protein